MNKVTFDNQHVKQYPQYRSIFIADKSYKLNKFLKLNIDDNATDAEFCFNKPIVMLSELVLLMGMCGSGAEFKRKLKEKAVRICGKDFEKPITIEKDTSIDITEYNYIDIFIGKRVLHVFVSVNFPLNIQAFIDRLLMNYWKYFKFKGIRCVK